MPNTLILLPGLVCDSATWAAQIQALSQRVRCHVPDYGLRDSITAMAQQYAAQINALLNRPDAAPVLPTITCPTLVLTGREDLWSPPEQHERMAAAIEGAELCIVEQCGHMSTMEQPDAVTAAFGRWLLG